jgi:hypothetical protein
VPARSANAGDGFSDPLSGFAVLSDEDGGVAYVEARYDHCLTGVRWYSPSGRIEQDVVVNRAQRSQVDAGEIGVLCLRDLEHYRWRRGDGQAAIWQVADSRTSFLQDWAPVSGLQLQPGAPLQLRAECRAGDLRLEADGRLLAEALDPQPVARHRVDGLPGGTGAGGPVRWGRGDR